jgi:hypothetical protein
MNAVRGNDDVTLGDGAVCKLDASRLTSPFKSYAAVPSVHDVGRQRIGEHVHEIGAVHAVRRVPTRRIGDLNRSNQCSIVAIVAGIFADFGAPLLHCGTETDPLQVADTVRRDVHAGADLAERRGLLINRDFKSLRHQCVCREQTADSAADNDDAGPPLLGHGSDPPFSVSRQR